MRKQDVILLACSFGGIGVGLFVPFLADPLRWLPRASMLSILFVSFLSIDAREAWRNIVQYPVAVVLLVILKLFIMPVVCWGAFSLLLPEYALGAALIGGSATAVFAPFFAFMIKADFVLSMVGLVTTSLLLPLTLPVVLAFVGSLSQVEGGIIVTLPVLDMMQSLILLLLLPFIAAQFLRRTGPALAEKVLEYRQVLTLFTATAVNIVIFGKYSEIILASPQDVLVALAGAVLVMAVLFAGATTITFWMPPPKQLAFVVSCVAVNGVLALILSIEYFSAPEALLAAMYTAPFFASVPLVRKLGQIRGHDPA